MFLIQLLHFIVDPRRNTSVPPINLAGNIKPEYKYFSTHIIFGIKMDGNFTRKSRLVTYGPNIDAISSITSSILVSRKNVSISFLVLPFIDLDICACKIRNT